MTEQNIINRYRLKGRNHRSVRNISKIFYECMLDNVNFMTNEIVLDLCCGNGWFPYAISPKVKSVYGVDCVVNNKTEDNIILINSEAEPYLDKVSFKFDKIVIIVSLSFFDLRKLFRQLDNVQKKGGQIIIIHANPKSLNFKLWNTFSNRGRSKIKVHEHTLDTIIDVSKEMHWEILKIIPICKFPPILISPYFLQLFTKMTERLPTNPSYYLIILGK